MNYNIETSESFDKQAKRLQKHYASFVEDYNVLLQELKQNPQAGIDLGGGLRKDSYENQFQGKRKKWWCTCDFSSKRSSRFPSQVKK